MSFVAALLLLASRKWSYLLAGALSGYIIVYGLNLFITRPITMLEEWKWIQQNDTNILLEWNLQFVLGLIIFSFAVFYFVREIYRKNTLK